MKRYIVYLLLMLLSTVSVSAQSIVGKWDFKDKGGEGSLEFSSSGVFKSMAHTVDKKVNGKYTVTLECIAECPGYWELKGDLITITPKIYEYSFDVTCTVTGGTSIERAKRQREADDFAAQYRQDLYSNLNYDQGDFFYQVTSLTDTDMKLITEDNQKLFLKKATR